MNEDSNPTTLATSRTSWLSNATNTLISGGNFVSVSMGDMNLRHPITIQRGLDLLYQHTSPGAVHNSAERYDPPKCLPRTREAILQKIMEWVEMRSENMELFIWLYGAAGAGKSAIAQTIAEICEQAGLLAASFFFSRTAAGRNDISRLVLTIVSQLIQTIPEIRDSVLTTLGSDAHIPSSTPASQMRNLIVDPLNKVPPAILAKRPVLIIIDGLDECGNPDSQREILKFLASATSKLNAPLLFLVASRPGPDIRLTFNSDILKSVTHCIPLPDSSQTDQDLRLFLRTKFQEILLMHPMRSHIPPNWPSDDEIKALVFHASGQFIYVSTVMRFIQSSCHRPQDRLGAILALHPKDNAHKPFAGLDSLYLQILSSVKKEHLNKVLDILRCLVFIWGAEISYVRAAPERLEDFLGYRPGDLEIYMADLHALVYLPPPEKPHDIIRIHHESFPDFLVDRDRSGEFFLDAPNMHANLVHRWIPYMEKYRKLERWRPEKMALWVDAQFYHIARAPCSPQLIEVLTRFNYFDIINDNDCYDFSLRSIPGFLTWLCENRSSGALSAETFNLQFRHFDQYVHHALVSLPPLYQKCIPPAVSLTTFYGRNENATRILLIIGSLTTHLSHLFFSHPVFRRLDPSFRNTLPFLRQFFSDPWRSGVFFVTKLSYKHLALRCAEVVFDPTWTPDDGWDSPWEETHVDGLRKTAIECLSLTLPKASKSRELAKFLREHALQVCLADRLYQQRRELATVCLKYVRDCGILLWDEKHDDEHFCIVCEESTHPHSSWEGVQMWVKHLFGFT